MTERVFVDTNVLVATKGRREIESELACAYAGRADDLLEEIGEMLRHTRVTVKPVEAPPRGETEGCE